MRTQTWWEVRSSSEEEVLRDPHQADNAHSALLRPQPASLPALAEEEVSAQAGGEATEVNNPALMDATGSNGGQWLRQGPWLEDHSSALISLVSAGISSSGLWETAPICQGLASKGGQHPHSPLSVTLVTTAEKYLVRSS